MPSPARPVRTSLPVLVAALLALVAAGLAVLPAPAAHAAGGGTDVVSRGVVFSLVNSNGTTVACSSDGRTHRVRARLVGPRREVLGDNVDRVNVLVHDLSTGSWFWHLRARPSYDYASALARHGETSLVIDRLGYGDSPLRDGNATCLGAQADMLHQVVQHLHSGIYRFTSGHAAPSSHHVVLQGHSTGAAIAQLEAATYDDVDGLVMMSWTDTGATVRAVDEARRQTQRCAGRGFARFGGTDRNWRRLLFRTAPGAVQRAAADRRSASPCGDVLSLTQTVTAGRTSAGQVEAPVLLLFGGRDRLNRSDAEKAQAQSYDSSVRVRRTTVAGAGSALPLERSAATTRARVLSRLATVD